MINNLQNAIDLHMLGFNIFPLRGVDENIPKWFLEKHKNESKIKNKINWLKTPRFAYTQYRDQKACKKQIIKWWTQYPSSNVGIITNKLVVIDADNQKTDQWCYRNIFSSIRVKTKRGKHYYFRYNPSLKISTINNGSKKIDIRGYNGIITGVGSTHGSGFKYKWDIEHGFQFKSVHDIPMIKSNILDKIYKYYKS